MPSVCRTVIHEIAAEFLENILETLKPHEGMNWEKTSAKLMKYCKEMTARFIRAAAELHDWSIFDGEPIVMDGASETQLLIKSCGAVRELLS